MPIAKTKTYRIVVLMFALMIALTLTACGGSKDEDKDDSKTSKKTSEEKPYYYNKDNKERYDAYQKANPDLSWDEVIWHVEANIDKLSYEDTEAISEDEIDSEQLLINKHFVLKEEYKPSNLVEFKGGYYATENTVKAFKKMEKAAAEDGITLDICSAYRTFAYQKGLYERYTAQSGQAEADTYSARPGSSEHHTGRAIDLIELGHELTDYENSESCAWVHKNAYKYGFILRYGKDIQDVTGYMYEAWHITYVGTDAAKTMHDENIEAFEEYWVKYVKYHK